MYRLLNHKTNMKFYKMQFRTKQILIKNWLRASCWLQFWERNYVSRPHEKMMAFKPTRQTSMGS